QGRPAWEQAPNKPGPRKTGLTRSQTTISESAKHGANQNTSRSPGQTRLSSGYIETSRGSCGGWSGPQRLSQTAKTARLAVGLGKNLAKGKWASPRCHIPATPGQDSAATYRCWT